MIRNELYKIFSQKIVYIAFIMLMSLQLFHFFNELPDSKQLLITKQAFQSYGGLVTEEKLNWATKTLKSNALNELAAQLQTETDAALHHSLSEKYMEERAKFDVANAITKLDTQKNNRVERQTLTEQLIATNKQPLAADQKISFLIKENIKLKQIIDYPSYAFLMEGWRNILNYFDEVGFLVIGALIIISVAGLYSQEYNTKMDAILLSSRFGRTRAPLTKIIAVILLSNLIVILFFGVTFAGNAIVYGLDGIDKSLINVTHFFSSTTFGYSIGWYILLRLILVCIGASSLALLVLLLSSYSRTPLIAAFVSGFIFLLPFAVIVMGPIIPYPLLMGILLLFRYFDFLQFSTLANNYYIELFGYAMDGTLILLGQALLYSLLASISLLLHMRKRQVN